MKLNVSELADGEIRPIVHNYEPSMLNVEYDGVHYLENISLRGELSRVTDAVHLSGELTSRVEQSCARCLKPIAYSVAERVDLFYDTQNLEELDATNDLRELLVLSYDPKRLCRENCLGLCPGCGADRNVDVCVCLSSEKTAFDALARVIKDRQRL